MTLRVGQKVVYRWSQEVAAWCSTKSLLRGKYRYAGRVPYGDKWVKP
jgi:hypothetical protein